MVYAVTTITFAPSTKVTFAVKPPPVTVTGSNVPLNVMLAEVELVMLPVTVSDESFVTVPVAGEVIVISGFFGS